MNTNEKEGTMPNSGGVFLGSVTCHECGQVRFPQSYTIPFICQKCRDLVDECEPCICGGTGNHDGQPIDACDECAPSVDGVLMGRWSNDA